MLHFCLSSFIFFTTVQLNRVRLTPHKERISLSSFCTRSMVSTEPAFKPFVSAELFDPGPWLPFSLHNDGAYESFRHIYEQYTANGVRCKTLEKAAKNTTKSLVLGNGMRIRNSLQPSNCWLPFMGDNVGKNGQGFMEFSLMTCLSLWSAPSLMLFGTPEF